MGRTPTMKARHEMSTITLTKGNTPNETRVTIGALTLHFSYETIVAYQLHHNVVVSENVWSKTTGKHLNAIDGGGAYKSARLPHAEFETELANTLRFYGLEN